MAKLANKLLSGWGKSPNRLCPTYRPEKKSAQEELSHLIMRGLGRSYGDQSFSSDGVVSCQRLNHFDDFDKKKGLITVQAGVSLSEILKLIVPQGWVIPVLTGTANITVGGAIANNVHGKNHYNTGCFGEYVSSLTLITPDGEKLICSASKNKNMFMATIAGSGMTGAIESATLKLKKIKSPSLNVTRTKVNNLDDMLQSFKDFNKNSQYMVGWIDHFAKGDNLGQGIFQTANEATKKESDAQLADYDIIDPKFNVPSLCPRLINNLTMRLYSKYYTSKHVCQQKIESINEFYFPLDKIGDWNNLYGKKGLLQFNCILPDSKELAEQLHDLLNYPHENGCYSYLAVLKYHRNSKRGIMSFATEGYSLAMDFNNCEKNRDVILKLYDKVVEFGGKIYLAKDSFMSAYQFRTMYKDELPKWRKQLLVADPEGKLKSSMAKRLRFKED